jgi:hypothetical protein
MISLILPKHHLCGRHDWQKNKKGKKEKGKEKEYMGRVGMYTK